MATLILETRIDAPLEKCFDAARDIDMHCRTATHTKERAVAGVTSGLINLGDSVTFEAVHFGVRQRLTGLITRMEPPHVFEDRMTEGAFKSFHHVHEFETRDGGTLMRDTMSWEAPLGPLGRLADFLFLKRYMTHFLKRKNAAMKAILEAEAGSAEERD